MKPFLLTTAFLGLLFSFHSNAQTGYRAARVEYSENKQSVTVAHQEKTGDISSNTFTKHHTKDINGEKLFEVNFLKYWVDDKQGRVYHISSKKDLQDFLDATFITEPGNVQNEALQSFQSQSLK